MDAFKLLLIYPGDVALVGWTLAVPAILLVLAFKARSIPINDKLQIGVLLLLTWLVTSFVISATNHRLLRWDQGALIFMVTCLGVWTAMHRMIADLTWRYRWAIHVAVALLFGVFLLLLLGAYSFGTGQHH